MYMGDIYLIHKDYANAKRMYEEAMERSGDYASLGGLIKYLDRMLNLWCEKNGSKFICAIATLAAIQEGHLIRTENRK